MLCGRGRQGKLQGRKGNLSLLLRSRDPSPDGCRVLRNDAPGSGFITSTFSVRRLLLPVRSLRPGEGMTCVQLPGAKKKKMFSAVRVLSWLYSVPCGERNNRISQLDAPYHAQTLCLVVCCAMVTICPTTNTSPSPKSNKTNFIRLKLATARTARR